MHAWLKRAVAGLLSAGTLLGGGLLTAGTANADEIRMPDIGKTITSLTTSAATTYPRELVNGGFDYLPAGGWKTVDAPSYMTNAYTSVDPSSGYDDNRVSRLGHVPVHARVLVAATVAAGRYRRPRWWCPWRRGRLPVRRVFRFPVPVSAG